MNHNYRDLVETYVQATCGHLVYFQIFNDEERDEAQDAATRDLCTTCAG